VPTENACTSAGLSLHVKRARKEIPLNLSTKKTDGDRKKGRDKFTIAATEPADSRSPYKALRRVGKVERHTGDTIQKVRNVTWRAEEKNA